MPCLGRMRQESLWGRLRSTIPPVTAPAWAALSTGKNPGKTGVFSFYRPVGAIGSFRPISSLDVQSETLPEALERAGLKVHVVNLPTFSYPHKIKGTVLGDILCPPEKAVHPEELLQDPIFKAYRSFPNMSLKGDLVRYVRDIRQVEEARFKCAAAILAGSWDFVFVMFSGVDWVQHELYGDLLAGSRSTAADEAVALFRDLDRYLEAFRRVMRASDHMVLVSDHGFRRTKGTVSLNRWLIEGGYLKERPGRSLLSAIAGRVPALSIPGAFVSFVSRSPKIWKLARSGWRVTAGDTGFTGRIAPDALLTKAFSQDYTWGIYINSKERFERGILDVDQAEATKTQVMAGLQGLVNEGLIQGCRRSYEVYDGKFRDLAPDIMVIPSERGVSVTRPNVVEDVPANGHSMDGIYLVSGVDIPHGEGSDASICDVFPTVMSLFRLGIPGDLDGKSLVSDHVSDDSTRPSPAPDRALSRDEEALIHGRLSDLGYV